MGAQVALRAVALDCSIDAVFADFNGEDFTLPHDLLLQLIDLGVDIDTTGFPLLHDTPDRGTLFQGILNQDDDTIVEMNRSSLFALGPSCQNKDGSEVVTADGFSSLDLLWFRIMRVQETIHNLR